MDADSALEIILSGCERLRWLPESRWLRPPLAPLGTRAIEVLPHATGPSLEVRAQEVASLLMTADADARGVAYFVPDVSVFALPDVVAALAKSLAELHTDVANSVLAAAAAAASEW
jgi:hypothetical protein